MKDKSLNLIYVLLPSGYQYRINAQDLMNKKKSSMYVYDVVGNRNKHFVLGRGNLALNKGGM